MIEFTVYGEPVAQGRPRFSTANGFARAYDPAKSSNYKDYVRLAATQYAPDQLLVGPLYLEVTVFRPIPKSFSKKKASEAEAGRVFPVTKPDTDNYGKGIKDALKGVLWVDDNQIVDDFVKKRYSNKPRIEIKVEAIA
ncbi:Holliday junction resolvase RusA-like endonuclease [Paenibacillus anaericanus]|uniref:RusA family crossover junction endodeoxyribonuclease n=1 Tax=Paenibacillus anaericanus TaxID=170367 RepID=UPI00277F45E7|nr:RusA family crossover junction endodeoxyribonuclease [Paenibacillus anaericanus]MDQ0091631.1 Holliday junction resolvase RusA-like endonuclease [Paenibacillus anaericanus]